MTITQELPSTQMTINSKHKWKKGGLGTASMLCTQRTIPTDSGAHQLQGAFQVPKERMITYVTIKLRLPERSYYSP